MPGLQGILDQLLGDPSPLVGVSDVQQRDMAGAECRQQRRRLTEPACHRQRLLAQPQRPLGLPGQMHVLGEPRDHPHAQPLVGRLQHLQRLLEHRDVARI